MLSHPNRKTHLFTSQLLQPHCVCTCTLVNFSISDEQILNIDAEYRVVRTLCNNGAVVYSITLAILSGGDYIYFINKTAQENRQTVLPSYLSRKLTFCQGFIAQLCNAERVHTHGCQVRRLSKPLCRNCIDLSKRL